jgi:hypothetical protein
MELRNWLANAGAAPPPLPGAPSVGYPQEGATRTTPGAYWYYQTAEELRNVLLRAGLTPDPATLTQLSQAIRRINWSNLTTITATGSLTADNCGLVLVNAAGGSITITLPAANVMAPQAAKFVFRRTDSSANTVTVQRAGADTIDGGTNFTLQASGGMREIYSDAGSAWYSVDSLETYLFASPGWVRLPSGLIIQWGQASSSSAAANNAVATFPVTFPNGCLSAIAQIGGNSAGNYTVQVSTFSASSVTMTVQLNGAYTSGVAVYWIAIGR